MVGENLDAGSDDERHEEKVQEMLHPQPCRETVGNGQRGRRDAGVPQEEILHRRQFPQRLSHGHADDGEHKPDRQRPQHVEPTPADPDLGHDANLGRHPIVQEHAVVRRAEACLDGIVWECAGWFHDVCPAGRAAFSMFIADKICATISGGCGSIETMIGFSSGPGSSSASNWLCSRLRGMKCSCRVAMRRAIKVSSPLR